MNEFWHGFGCGVVSIFGILILAKAIFREKE